MTDDEKDAASERAREASGCSAASERSKLNARNSLQFGLLLRPRTWVAVFVWLWEPVSIWRRRRAALHELGRLSPRMLKDIGLNRGDIWLAAEAYARRTNFERGGDAKRSRPDHQADRRDRGAAFAPIASDSGSPAAACHPVVHHGETVAAPERLAVDEKER